MFDRRLNNGILRRGLLILMGAMLVALVLMPAPVLAEDGGSGAADISGSSEGQPALTEAESAGGPDLQITAPEDGQLVKEPVALTGTVAPGAAVQVNGSPVPVDASGDFSAILQLSEGANVLTITAEDQAGNKASVERTVFLDTTPPVIVSASIQPGVAMDIRPGDLLVVKFRGEPGGRAGFKLGPLPEEFPMVEAAETPGFYTGAYQAADGDRIDNAAVEVHLADAAGNLTTALAQGMVKIGAPPVPEVGVSTSERTVLRTGPSTDYDRLVHLPAGIKLWLTGKLGNWYRVRLAEGMSAWVNRADLRLLPAGTLPPAPVLTFIQTEGLKDRTRIAMSLTEPAAFSIEENPRNPGLLLNLYNASSGIVNIHYQTTDRLTGLITSTQRGTGLVQLQVALDSGYLRGYQTYYDNNTLVLEVKKPFPRRNWLERLFSSSVKGKVIVIDPGHGGNFKGAVGPAGIEEKAINLDISERLAKLLNRAGARVVLTRTSDVETVPGTDLAADLYQRVATAEEQNADFFISIHNNATPENAPDRMTRQGSEAFYYYPQSLRAARILEDSVVKTAGTVSRYFGFQSIAVIRQTTMPAVLVEGDYLSNAGREAKLATPGFRQKIAAGIFKGVETYFAELERGGK